MDSHTHTPTRTRMNGDVGNVLISLYTRLVRGLSESYICSMIAEMSEEYIAEHLEDLLVMTLHIRDVRGGKGERDLFYHLMGAICTRMPKAVEALIPLVPEYGCWRDLWELHDRVPTLQHAIYVKVQAQWTEDRIRINGHSLLAKWLPREGSASYPQLALIFANILYPHIPYRSRLLLYRKEVAAGNRLLKTVEINMCAHSWGDIDPTQIPGRCFHTRKAAFLNKKLQARIRGSKNGLRQRTGEERMGSKDRRKCAQNVEAFLEKTLTGRTILEGAEVVQKDGVETRTPLEVLRAILDNKRYDKVRQAVREIVLNIV